MSHESAQEAYEARNKRKSARTEKAKRSLSALFSAKPYEISRGDKRPHRSSTARFKSLFVPTFKKDDKKTPLKLGEA